MNIVIFAFLMLWPSAIGATTYYIDMTAGNCAGTYSVTDRNCTGSDGTSYGHTTISSMAAVAGDIIYVRAATLTTPFALGSKAGADGADISIIAYPGETVTMQPTDPTTHMITQTCSAHHWIFKGFVFDGINGNNDLQRVMLRSNCGGMGIPGHFKFYENDIKNMMAHAFLVNNDGWHIARNKIHDLRSACTFGNKHYGIYVATGSGHVIEQNEIYNTPGGYMQVYPGPLDNVKIHDNYLHDNTFCSAIGDFGGTISQTGASGQITTNVEFYNNIVAGNNFSGLQIGGGVDNVKIVNNIFYNNNGPAINISSAGSTGTVVQNNIILGNTSTVSGAGAAGATQTTNRTTGAITDCTISTSDFRLKDGTNPCRDAGTATPLRPVPVGVVDIGSFEQGAVASAVVASGFIEATVNVMTPGVLPTLGITSWSISCVGCTGSPVVSAAHVKPGANNVVLLKISGITAAGSCTVSYAPGNMVDSLIVGAPSTGTAQLVNSVTALAVSGTCDNSAGGAPPTTPHIHHKMNEGSGTNLNDETANNLDSTLSGSPSWTTAGFEGAGLSFASEVDQRATFAYGNALNATTQSFTFCLWVKPNPGMGNKIIMGPPNGLNMRMYVGSWNGQTWQLGVGASGQSSVQSEFPVTTTWTRLCVVNDASTDTTTLAVNGVKGTSAAAVKSSSLVTSLAGNLLIGCGHFTGVALCGGFTADEPKIWTRALSQADLTDDVLSYSPAGSAVACYAQGAYQAESPLLVGNAPMVLPLRPDGSIDVVAGGSVALKIDLRCTGSAGDPISIRPYYSVNGVDFQFPVPDQLGAGGIAMLGLSALTPLNNGVSSGCVDAAGLTPNNGSTVLTSVTSATVTLSQDHCTSVRILVHVGLIAGQSRTIRWHQDNGAVLAGSYPVILPKLNVVATRANAGP